VLVFFFRSCSPVSLCVLLWLFPLSSLVLFLRVLLSFSRAHILSRVLTFSLACSHSLSLSLSLSRVHVFSVCLCISSFFSKAESRLTSDQVTLVGQLVELFQDVDYLCEMKLLEKRDIQENNDKAITMTNIVPVSGLIFSRFYRVENELMTILELWGDNRLRRTASTRRLHEENRRLIEQRKGKAAFRELNWEKLEKKRNVKIMRIFLTQHHFKTIPVELPASAQDVCDSLVKKLRV
jgi:hypothetical protein